MSNSKHLPAKTDGWQWGTPFLRVIDLGITESPRSLETNSGNARLAYLMRLQVNGIIPAGYYPRIVIMRLSMRLSGPDLF